MRISNLVINNFKNFLGRNPINLDNDINIIYGDNGFGKSTFFEAIEWCITGEIDKYNNLGDKDFDENDLINYHVKLGEGLCSVEIEFGNNILIRSFKILNKSKEGNTNIKIINSKTNVTIASGKNGVDNFMKSDYLKTNTGSIERFGEMVKSAYILSQDQISEFIFQDSSQQRYKAISSIMGLQSSVNLMSNFKKIKVEVGKQKDLVDDKINALKSQILGSDNNRILINENEFIKYNNDLFIENKEKLSAEQVKEFRKNNEIDIDNNKKISQIMYNLIDEKIESLEMLYNKLEENKNKLSNSQNTKYDIKNKISLNENSSLKLESEKNNMVVLTSSLNEITSLKNKINESKLGFDTNIIKINLNDHLKYKEQLFYAKDNYEYNSIKKTILEIPNEIRNKTNEIILLKDEEIANKLDLTKQYEITLNNKETLLFSLSKALKTVHMYVTENDTKGCCPVCNSYVGKNIQEVINNQILTYDDIINRIKDTSKIYELSKEKINNKLDNMRIKINKLVSNKNELQRQLDISFNQLDNIKENELFIEEIFLTSIFNITNEVDRINKIIEKERYIIEKNISLNNLLNKNKHLLNISNVEQFNTNTIDKEIMRIKLVNHNLEIDFKKITSDILDYEDKINKYKNYINLFKTEYNNIFNIDMSIKFDILKNQLIIKNNEILNSVCILEKYEKLLMNIEFNSKIDLNISTLKSDICILEKRITKLIGITDSIDEILNTTKNVFGEGIKEFLNKPESNVNKFFKYLNPIPTMSDLKFDGDGETLVVNVKCDCEGDVYRSVGKTLSSGQLNVLAIAIFLAINNSQKIYDLDFVALDDPIQNMDDVNQFSICDVLGQLNKQLIFSTHDADFIRLFVKKNEFKKEKIQIIDLKSRYLEKDKINFIKFNL